MVKKAKNTINSTTWTINMDCYIYSTDKRLNQNINIAHLQIATEVMI